MLDKKDEIIFEYLMHDCRISTLKLAKLTRLSQSTVVYRIQKLESEGYIRKYDAIFNLNRIDVMKEFFFFSVPVDKKEDFEKKMVSLENVTSMLRTLNKFNYWAYLMFKDEDDKKNFIAYLEENGFEYENYKVREADLLPFSIYDVDLKLPKKKFESTILKLDETDIKLMKVLADGGGRDSILELNKKLQINYDTLLYRFKRLVKAGYFQLFMAQPGTEKFHIQFDIFMFRTKDLSYEQLNKLLENVKPIVYVVDLGNGVYFTQVLTQKFEEYKEVLEKLNDKLRENLESMEVFNSSDWIVSSRYPFEWLLDQ